MILVEWTISGGRRVRIVVNKHSKLLAIAAQQLTPKMGSLLEAHRHGYMEHAKECALKLQEAWDMLELSMEERQAGLQATMDAAVSAWDASVAKAQQRRLLVLSQVESIHGEVARIAEQMGSQHHQQVRHVC